MRVTSTIRAKKSATKRTGAATPRRARSDAPKPADFETWLSEFDHRVARLASRQEALLKSLARAG